MSKHRRLNRVNGEFLAVAFSILALSATARADVIYETDDPFGSRDGRSRDPAGRRARCGRRRLPGGPAGQWQDVLRPRPGGRAGARSLGSVQPDVRHLEALRRRRASCAGTSGRVSARRTGGPRLDRLGGAAADARRGDRGGMAEPDQRGASGAADRGGPDTCGGVIPSPHPGGPTAGHFDMGEFRAAPLPSLRRHGQAGFRDVPFLLTALPPRGPRALDGRGLPDPAERSTILELSARDPPG